MYTFCKLRNSASIYLSIYLSNHIRVQLLGLLFYSILFIVFAQKVNSTLRAL